MGSESLCAACIRASASPGSCSAPLCLKTAGVLAFSSVAASHPTPPGSFWCWWEKSNFPDSPPNSSRSGCIHILLKSYFVVCVCVTPLTSRSVAVLGIIYSLTVNERLE